MGTLAWRGSKTNVIASIKFLIVNDQLKKLGIPLPAAVAFLEMKVWPWHLLMLYEGVS
jgi:hypothetical protein